MRILDLKSSLIAVGLVLLAGSLPAAGYLKIGDIKGESKDAGYEEWIAVYSTEWVKPCPSHVIAAEPAELELPDIVVRKRIDASSPHLMRLHGLHLGAQRGINPQPPPQDVTIVQTLPFGDGVSRVVAIWDLSDVIVSSWSTSGDADDRPTEEVAFAFGAARQTYFERGPGGDLVNVQTQGFVLREGSTIPPPPGTSTSDSFIIGEFAPAEEHKATDGVAKTEGEEARSDI